jgi:hypothetical protein
MPIFAYHITFDLRGRAPIPRNSGHWARITRTLGRVLEPWENLAFSALHDHLHAALACDREGAGRAVHAVECSLGWFLRPAGSGPRRSTWNPARIKPIDDQRQLANTIPYILRNGYEATGFDPLLWRWSSGWDRLGFRVERHALRGGFEGTSLGATARALTGDATWRPAIAKKLTSPAESVETLLRVVRVSRGLAPEEPGRNSLDESEIFRTTVQLAVHRGWSASAAAQPLGFSRQAAWNAMKEDTNPVLLTPPLRILALMEGGVQTARVLADAPPDPLPTERPRRIRGEMGGSP